MQDKSFPQAIQDLQERLSNDFQDTIDHMLMYRTTVTKASSDIQDEKMRAIVKNTLVTGQMIALFALMKEMHILDDAQYDEFTTYLMHALVQQ